MDLKMEKEFYKKFKTLPRKKLLSILAIMAALFWLYYNYGTISYVRGQMSIHDMSKSDYNILLSEDSGHYGYYWNKNSLAHLKFNSMEIDGKLRFNKEYTCKVYGFENFSFNIHKNVINCVLLEDWL